MKTLTGTIRYRNVSTKFKCTIYDVTVNPEKFMRIDQYNRDIIDLEVYKLMNRHKQ